MEVIKCVKCIVVGDSFVRQKIKTLITYIRGEYPGDYIPTIFENYSANIVVGDQPIALVLWDTTGQEDYDRNRPITYPGTDVVILVFSTVYPPSLENVTAKWFPEIEHYIPKAKIILAGCHVELRNDIEVLGLPVVSYDQGRAIAKGIVARGVI